MGVTRLVGLVLLLCAVGLAGCGKKDKIVQPIVPPRYPVLSTPQNVMDALVKSYRSRDSVEYGLLFDIQYWGTSIDNTAPSPQTLNFMKTDEVHHVAVLAKSSTISSVTLDFGPTLVRSTDPSDSAGWATIQISYINLLITDTPSSYALNSAGETMEFKFKPTTPAPSSPTDTTWKIVRWTEIRN